MNLRDEMNRTIYDLNYTVNLFASTTDELAKNNLLNYMRYKIYDLYIINNHDSNNGYLNNQKPVERKVPVSQTNRSYTKDELSQYNGKNGMPAYVAVNGTVYDVTNNAAWGAATHFGLSAGNDLTTQFASCHAGQTILQKLLIVGKMIE